MESGIPGRIALVTGASAGLGRRFAGILAQAGARVALAARRTDRLAALEQEIRAAGGEAIALALDVADVGAVRAAAAEVEQRLGPIAILVNNAGVSRQQRLEEVEEADWDAVLDTNLKGAFFLAQAAARQMIRHGIAGRIVNIGSIAGERPLGRQGPYSISKAALAHMTHCMAREWGRHGINTNAIAPGYIVTEMAEDFLTTEAGHRMVQSLPRQRMGEPRDLDALLLLLCSDGPARFINGSVMVADDGLLSA
ncbi:Gluconate 5-dehydrogenase [Rhodovastum atsumiense]|uniref:SDR family NAD(P)-dependent oxidoreductase n=1 Tax=Rhodovastum atsumiense TaxID=504468 RepID=A0A5M6IPU1_9PROT|nr:SDR family NAD(P)-dependent oxidoreductase [Rhodovastum atsumiense]KAA5609919.1 SDR family NAD(P)-dependent oxidoreductase [Rhodovastum atsumiense]CAH2604535.1 Gluconate 5-dehydrogenase [Rhodovastum atsumiense]